MRIIIKSKSEANHIHPFARKKYGETLTLPDLFAVQRKYCGEVRVREWITSQCNSKTACFETVAKQTDVEVIDLLRREIEKRILAGEGVKVTVIPKDAEGNNLSPIIIADVPQENVERLTELYTLQAGGKEYDEAEMEALGLNLTPADTLFAV